LAIFILVSCTKKTEVSGLVFDKNHNPMPNAKIKFTSYNLKKNRSTPAEQKIITTSNQNGEYFFSFKGKKNYSYSIYCVTDSTKATSGFGPKIGVVNKFNFFIYQ